MSGIISRVNNDIIETYQGQDVQGDVGDSGVLSALADIALNVKQLGAKGDGVTDDTTFIQNAINSLTNGGTVFFPYTLNYYKISKALVIPSNITLLGDWNKPKIKQTGTGADYLNGCIIINQAFLNNSSGTDYNENIHIFNLTLESRYQEFTTASSSNPMWLYGIYFSRVLRSSITDNKILNTVSESVYIGGSAPVPCEDIIVKNNHFENSYASAIAITNGKKIKVVENTIYNANTFGIDIEPNTSCLGVDIQIKNNTIDTVNSYYFKNNISQGQSNSHGISVQSGSLANQTYSIVVSGNIIRNVQRYTTSAIINFGSIIVNQSNNVTVSNNTIENSQATGIVVRGGSQYVTVTGNGIRGGDQVGILTSTSGTRFVTIQGNVINVNNTGISVQDSSQNITVANNTIADPNPKGILIQNSKKVSVVGNNIEDTRSAGSVLMTYGIHVYNGNDVITLDSNVITNSTGNAVQNADGSTNVYENGNGETGGFWRIRNNKFHVFSDGNIYQVGWIKPTAITASTASNGTIFVDSADNKLKFKDSTGTIQLLY